jgi:hypothetical protein
MSFTLNDGVSRPLALPSERLWAMNGSHSTGTSAKYSRTGRATSTLPATILISSVSKW